MIIETISPTLQNLFIYNFEQMGKLFLIILPLFLSIYFLNFTWKSKEESPYLLVGIFRIMFYWISKTYLFISPITIFALHPFFDFWTLAQIIIIFYLIALIIGTVLIIFNILYFSPIILFRKAGINFNMKGTNKALNMIEKQWGINYGKN